MEYTIFITLIIFVIILIMALSYMKSNKKLKLKLNESFGKIPKQQKCDFDSIKYYYHYKKTYQSNSDIIDDITWNDLDMDKVFKRINVCLTSVGEEYLYNILHEVQFKEHNLLKREKLISYLKSNKEDRLKLQMIMSKLGKYNYNGIASFIFNANAKSLKYTFIYNILAFFPVASILIMLFNIYIGIFCLIIFGIMNGIVYYKTKMHIEIELSAIKYFSSILWCCNKICRIKSLEAKPFLNDLRKSFNTFKSLRSKISGMMQKSVSDIDVLLEYVKIIFLTDIRNYNKALNKISKYSDDFHNLYKSVGEIDLSICVLSFRESLPFYTVPDFHDENLIKFEDLYHPLLSNPIYNSGEINSDSIITGSNASGKSTFIKALAINGILAQTIYTCAAKKIDLRFSLIITSMAVRDNISAGDSYFITEIKSLKRILDKIQNTVCTCFIDEILKGTNTIERIAASASVLKYLHDSNCRSIVASHDIELTNILKNKYDNYHFREQITDEGIIFDYKLKNGVSQTRNAIKLLHYMEFDQRIVENAENLVNKFNSDNAW